MVDRALEKDRARASAEYLAEFRTDIEGFVSLEVVEACVSGYHELGPRSDVKYRGFIGPSGGSGNSMTLAIAHKTPKAEEMIVIDVIREARPPFSPEAVVDEFAALCKLYGITQITGDHFGGEFVKEPFRRHGLSYEIAKQPKSNLYRDLLPLLNSGRAPRPPTTLSRSAVSLISVSSGNSPRRAFCASSCPVARSTLRTRLEAGSRTSGPDARRAGRWSRGRGAPVRLGR